MHKPQARQATPQTRGRTIHWARFYDAATELLFLGKAQAVREMTLELARIEAGDKLLDVGCGTGSLTVAAKARVGPAGEAHGIDAAPEMIEVARRKAAHMGLEVDFQVGLIEDIPFPEDEFDLVLSSLMLHHLPADLKRQGFLEIRRVLKAGGRFLAVDFEPPTNPWLRGLATLFFGHEMMLSDLRQLGAMLEEAGFSEVEGGRTQFRALAFLRARAG